MPGQAAFPDEFKGQLFDGAQPDPGVRVVQRLRNGTAVTQSASGEKAVLQSSLPLETENAAGQQQPVDLSLASDSTGFRTRNAFVDLRIAKRAHGGVLFPQGGFSISPGGGSDAAAAESADRVFFANTQADTDFIVAPRPAGAELGWQLRSPASPERLTLDVDLPAGAVLRRARTDTPIPGDAPKSFEIAKGDDAIAYIQPPNAYDADGVPVPSEAAIDGDSIVVTVKHRDGDYRYPLFVDPEMQINDYHGSNWAGWRAVSSPYNPTPNTRNYYGATASNCAYYCGLYLSMPTNTAYSWTGTSIYWQYRAIANTYIYAGTFGGMGHIPSTPYAAYGAPYNAYPWVFSRWFNGIFNGAFTNWEANTNYLNQGGAYGPNPFGPSWGGASGITHAFCLTAPGPRCDRENTPPSDSNALILGLNAKNDINQNDINTLGSRASVTMAWSNTYLNDRYDPSIGSPTPPSKDWTDDSAAPDHPLNVNVLDAGLGAYDVSLSGWGTGTQAWYRGATCTGDPQRSPCPLNWSPPALSYHRLDEGVNTLTLRATDIVDNAATPQTWTEKIDRTPPNLATLTGNLWEAREQPTDHRSEGFYGDQATLSVPISDAYSGVKEVVVLRDGVQWGSPATLTAGTATWTLNLDNSLPDGRYKIEIAARDNVWSAASASADRHEKKTEPFYITIDRSGDVVRAELWDGDPATTTSSNDASQWARVGAGVARTEESGGASTLTDAACSTDTTGRCAAMVSVNDDDGPGGIAPQYRKVIGATAGDHRIFDAFLTRRTPPGTATAAGTVTGALEPWQNRPPGAGNQATRYRTTETETIDGQEVTVIDDVHVDDQTGLPLRIDHIEGNRTPERLYFGYNVQRKAASDYAADFFALTKPSPLSADTETVLPAEGNEPSAPTPSEATVLQQSLDTREVLGLTTDQSTVQNIINDLASSVRAEALDIAGIPLTQIELDQLKSILNLQSYTKELESYVASNPSVYAGAYIDPTSRRLIVKLTEVTQAREDALRALIPVGSDLEFRTAAASLANLNALQAQIEADDAAGVLPAGAVTAVAVRQSATKVVVSLSPNAALTEAELQQRYGSNVIAETDDGAFQYFSNNDNMTRKAYAGRAIFAYEPSASSGNPCSMGSNGYTRNGQRRTFYGLIAAHCGYSLGSDLAYAMIGPFTALGDGSRGRNLYRANPAPQVTRDAASFRLNSARFRSDKQVIRDATGTKRRYARVTATGGVLENGMACWTGATTLAKTGVSQCARVNDTNVSRSTSAEPGIPQRRLHHLTELQRGTDSCGDTGSRYRGDSGAAGFAKRRGSQSIYHFGIFSGGFCDSRFLRDDVEKFYFQQIDGALNELGLRPYCGPAGCDF